MTSIAFSPTTARASARRSLLSRVPEVTVFFWIIKILATTVGETAADNLNETLGFGLTWTTVVMGVLLIGVLALQFRLARYVAGVYWLAVVLISVVGTLITDNLTDRFGVSLYLSTGVFSVLLALTFFAWWRREGTLSIHSIVTARREGFYWLAILFTFALGTAAGDLIGEQVGLGYLTSVGLFAAVFVAIAVAHLGLGANAVLSFWLAYIVTRPLGASMGDWMSQPKGDGGLALGTTGTSLIFLAAILVVVTYLGVTKIDRGEVEAGAGSGAPGRG
ncbi:MAG: hypothetical protein PGN13_15780 [Patulibacter minatonensis]